MNQNNIKTYKSFFNSFCQKIFDEHFAYDSSLNVHLKMSELSAIVRQDDIVAEFAAIAGFCSRNAQMDVVKVFKSWLEDKGIVYKNRIINGKQVKAYHCLTTKEKMQEIKNFINKVVDA